jgi:putative oxidoreductase
MWISHALLKWFVFTIPGLAAWLETQGFAGAFAWPLFLTELVGGIAILLGFYARHVALALSPILVLAASTHLANGWVFTNAGGGWEYPVYLTVASVAQWLIGDGAFALKSRPLWFVSLLRLRAA